ncbi:MAG: hypothetical protein CL450_05925 [Acidimicrobiaceae bacterium]|nr:hypothetical protein [Acidimicrobiaceae bacterium]|tara:strand:+ start:2637 stop:3236 length:600 start_codon:yes stop_codon:yes gene_type:complete
MKKVHTSILGRERESNRRETALRRLYNHVVRGGGVQDSKRIARTIEDHVAMVQRIGKDSIVSAKEEIKTKQQEIEQARQRIVQIKKEVADLKAQIKEKCAPLETLHKHLQYADLSEAETEKALCDCDAVSDWVSSTRAVHSDAKMICDQLECCQNPERSGSCTDEDLKELQKTLKMAKDRDAMLNDGTLAECQEFSLFN